MLTEPTSSDPIQNRRLTRRCWDGDHHRTTKDPDTNHKYVVGCMGWLPCPVHKKDPCPEGCAFKLKPEDSLDLPDVGTIEVK